MNEKKPEIIEYKTTGTCSQMVYVAISDNIIVDIEIVGGCNGNLNGIRSILRGMPIDFVIERFSGIRCGAKPTSCPDQIAQCLIQYKNKQLIPANS